MKAKGNITPVPHQICLAAGNVLNDGTYSYTWNAEGQMVAANGVTYTYDGDGKRVEKVNSKIYWYGLGSDALLETDWSGNLQNEYVFLGGKRIARRDSTSAVYYYLGDHLGTSRIIATSSGTRCYDADFGPYGKEAVYANTCPQNYKFTAKERDTETGNDYFGARFYENNLGRFATPDWAANPTAVPYANFGNPQSLNLYSYVENNPTTLGDPDGHMEHKCISDACGVDTFVSEINEETLGLAAAWIANTQAEQQAQQQSQASPQGAQGQLNEGGPNASYNPITGESCPDCKYYPREVQEAVHAHENQHRKDEHTLRGFFMLFTKKGRAELEVRAAKAELAVANRHINELKSVVGPLSATQHQTLIILNNIRDQDIGIINNPDVYENSQ